MANKTLSSATRAKNDEFYTQLTDIEKELKHYRKHFKGKTVLCNCDDPFESNFFKCIELLKESDIVVTNPPFSLFREYIYTLIKHDKNFIVIGNQNAITYKEIFPLLMRNRMWLGNNSGDMSFTVPDYYKPRETRYWQDETGQKWRSMGNICWFTNLDIKKRHEEMILVKRYNEDDYPKYDNYYARVYLELKKVKKIH